MNPYQTLLSAFKRPQSLGQVYAQKTGRPQDAGIAESFSGNVAGLATPIKPILSSQDAAEVLSLGNNFVKNNPQSMQSVERLYQLAGNYLRIPKSQMSKLMPAQIASELRSLITREQLSELLTPRRIQL